MTINLRQGLRDLGLEPQAQAAELGVVGVIRRVHRQRAMRATAYSVVGVGTAAAVVLGGIAAAQHTGRAPVAPAIVPSPTASPSIQATETPAILPVGDPSLPFGACGSLVGSAPSTPADSRFSIVASVAGTTVQAGAPLDVHASFHVTQSKGADVGLLPDQGPTFAVTRDGVVVGLADVFHGALTGSTFYSVGPAASPAEQPVDYRGSIDLTVCSAGDGAAGRSAGRPVPAGTYVLYPFGAVTALGAAGSVENPSSTGARPEDLAARPGAQHGTTLGEPITVTVTGDAVTTQPRADDGVTTVDLPAPSPQFYCGGPAPVVSDVGGFIRLDYDSSPRTIAHGAPFSLGVSATYEGPGHLRAYAGPTARVWIVRGGVVVGWHDYGPTGLSLMAATPWVDLAHGTSVDVSLDGRLTPDELTLTKCDQAGTGVRRQLDPGEYLAYPVTDMGMNKVTLPDGTQKAFGPAGAYEAVGKPIALTVS
jgi:hypothetical protein